MGRPGNDQRVLSPKDLIRLGRADLVSFSRWPLGYMGTSALALHQIDWQEQIQSFYENNLRLHQTVQENQWLGLLAPSEHGKTYGCIIPFIFWLLCRDRNLRIGVCGSKDNLAEAIGFGIDRLFLAHREELALFGLEPATPWNAQVKYVKRDDDRIIHPSITFFGPGNELQGVRFDVIINTDLMTMKNNRTHESRQTLMDWMDDTLFPRLEPWGFAMMEGHHVGEDDCYSQLEEREEEWRFLKYRAIIDEPHERNNWKGKVLWPARWTYKKLDRIRQRRPGTFSLIYQNQPISRAGFTTRENLERCLDRGRFLLTHGSPDLRSAYERLYLSLDPAFTIKRRSSHSVCLIWGVTKGGQRDLLGGWRLKLLPPQLKAKVVATILAWDLDAAFIEANAAQIFFVSELRERLGQKADLIKPVYTLSNEVTESVEAYVGEAVGLIESGQVTLPYADATARHLSDVILTELINFGQMRTRDALMSWQVMERGIAERGNTERKTHHFHGITGMRRRHNVRRT